MSRLLIGNEWYEGLSSNAYWEAEYERLVLQHAASLFPDYVAVPFKTTVFSEHGSVRPDFALVDPGYQVWWVVEVELAHHSLSAHVLPQVRAQAAAAYGETEAAYLARQGSNLDYGRLRDLMRGAQPRVLVIVNGPVNWRSALAPFGVLVCVIEIYRSQRDQHVLRMYGDVPHGPVPVISRCALDSTIPRLLLIESPGRMPPTASGKYDIQIDGSETEWEPIASRDRLWLSPVRTNPLVPGVNYMLTEQSGGRLVLTRDS